MEKILRIGTRGSKLALWQAEYTKARLQEQGIPSELKIIKTKGDKIQHLSFDKIEGKGFFTKEIEDTLLQGEVDLAVHSMKDMPTSQPEGLMLAAVSYRENPADWLVIRKEVADDTRLLKLPENPVIGTSSARRKAQMLGFRPDVQIKDIRGNVPTRLNKLRSGDFDAILLAAAGLIRLEMDLSAFEVVKFNPREFVPAPAQGVLVYQIAEGDVETRRLLKVVHDAENAKVIKIEREILRLMEGGCQMPLGAYCERDAAGNYHVWAAMADTWDGPLRKAHLSSSTSHKLAERIVEELKNKA